MDQPVPKGPLAVRWLGFELDLVRAGAPVTAAVELENAGTAAWRPERVKLSYHWLDDRDNPIVWDGLRTELERPVAPGERLRLGLRGRGPIPPGLYRLAVDLVDEGRLWFEEVGNPQLVRTVHVQPRIERPDEAVAHLPEGVQPAADWSQRVFEAHREGYAVVGGSVEAKKGLDEYAPGPGRIPNFPHPLVCPSVVEGVEVEWTEVAGLPAALPPRDEPWVYDARIRLVVAR